MRQKPAENLDIGLDASAVAKAESNRAQGFSAIQSLA
jgi:hypothetical protein